MTGKSLDLIIIYLLRIIVFFLVVSLFWWAAGLASLFFDWDTAEWVHDLGFKKLPSLLGNIVFWLPPLSILFGLILRRKDIFRSIADWVVAISISIIIVVVIYFSKMYYEISQIPTN